MDQDKTTEASIPPSQATPRGSYQATVCSAPPFVRVGPKGHHLAIPEGYEQIETGEAQDGDLFANLLTAQWCPVDRADIGYGAINFDYLIRRQNPSRQPRESASVGLDGVVGPEIKEE